MSRAVYRTLPADNLYSLASIERDLLAPANLKFKRNASGEIADVSSSRAGVEGSLGLEVVEPEGYTPELLLRALDGAERAEKEFMRTGKRELSINEKPGMDNVDFERAVIVCNLLDNPSLEMLATRGLHGKAAGNRMAKVDAVADLLYKASYGRDLYANTPILGRSQDQGHLESNSRGGVRLRPELSLVNQWLGDTEGADRLRAIAQARQRMLAAETFNDQVMNDKDVQKLMKYADFQKMVAKQPGRKSTYGYS